MARRRPRLTPAQARLLRRELGDGHPAREWFDPLLAGGDRRELMREWLAIGRGGGGASWADRHLAALLLEHLAWKLPAGDPHAHGELLAGLGLLAQRGGRLRDGVLSEGFTTTALAEFTPQFARWLARNEAIHHDLQRSPNSVGALRRFLHLAGQSCRVLLARYLISAPEVVAKFLAEVRTSEGKPSSHLIATSPAAVEAARRRADLPRFEAEILRLLLDRSEIFWVPERPERSLNALVEYPLTTVVLVLKPPGSWVEFEFKRAGYPRSLPLGVRYESDLPPAHCLDGGASGWRLEREAAEAAKVARVYRAAHGEDLPLSVPVSILSVHSVAVDERRVDIRLYLTDPAVFGPDHPALRTSIRRLVEHVHRRRRGPLPGPDDHTGLTREFLSAEEPAQAVMMGSSSFRVDQVAEYLTAPGVRRYFRAVRGRGPGRVEARLLVDTILAETLGVYRPPAARPRAVEDYVEAAFRLPANRRRANRVYLSLTAQAARFWASLLAWGAASDGESMVARNVGIRSLWAGGRWSPRLVFMDHDGLSIVPPRSRRFRPVDGLGRVELDEVYLVGRRRGRASTESLLNLLDQIYQVGPALRGRGRRAFRDELASSYRRIRSWQADGGRIGGLPGGAFLTSLRDWDEAVARYQEATARGAKDPRSGVGRWLRQRGYADRHVTEWLEALDLYSPLLAKYRFLFTRGSVA